MKGLTVYTLRSDLGDCTNGGISAKHNKFTITGNNIPEVFEPTEDAPELRLVYRPNLDYYHAEPAEDLNPHCVGWMAGGNFIYTSDSRFFGYPIPIHDRQETQAQYNLLAD